MSTIANGANRPLFDKAGDVPDVSGALQSYYQMLVFEPVGKIINGFQVVEKGNPINFRGVIQPLSVRTLILKPEGQRSWTWLQLHSDPVLTLQTDDVILWRGIQTRIMGRTDFQLYGYVYYELVQDWSDSGPT
jgi:hypothetical protein